MRPFFWVAKGITIWMFVYSGSGITVAMMPAIDWRGLHHE